MSVNLVVISGTVKSLALRYDEQGRPELRFTLAQQEKDRPLYVPCCASGSTAERLANELEDGMSIVASRAQLVYRKRSTQKHGEVSRMEVLIWQVDHPSVPQIERSHATESID